ncbi:antibiotic biosynthesis monooxygenase family protein [Streptomyces sp. NPDC054837]
MTAGGRPYSDVMSHDSEAPVIPIQAGMDQAHTPGGLSITVGYFRDADALTQWRTNAEHRAAQKRGRAEWYQSYSLHVAKVERSHAFTQEES